MEGNKMMEIKKSAKKVKIILDYSIASTNPHKWGKITEADLKKLNLKIRAKDVLKVGELSENDIEWITFSVKEGK